MRATACEYIVRDGAGGATPRASRSASRDGRLARSKKRANGHLLKLVKANVEKANGENKAKLDKDMEMYTGVDEEHGASSSTEMSTSLGIKRDRTP